MNEQLKDILTKYRDCTLEIIEIIESSNLDSLDGLINERQELVDRALSIQCTQEESKLMFQQLQLNELQEKLNTIIEKNLQILKSEMQRITKSKTANSMYNKNYPNRAIIFSKKI